jgi:hypothetical protein
LLNIIIIALKSKFVKVLGDIVCAIGVGEDDDVDDDDNDEDDIGGDVDVNEAVNDEPDDVKANEAVEDNELFVLFDVVDDVSVEAC